VCVETGCCYWGEAGRAGGGIRPCGSRRDGLNPGGERGEGAPWLCAGSAPTPWLPLPSGVPVSGALAF